MPDQELPDINEISTKFKEILNNTNWVVVARRLTGYKFEWFLWRLRKAGIQYLSRDTSIHGEVIHVAENQVIAALAILNEPIGEISVPGTEFTGNIVWDDLPNDHQFF